MGSDLTVVNSARVSFQSESWWEDAEKHLLKKGDQGLINFLARNNHWSPFAHPQLQFRYTVPIFLARQEFKHIVGFVRNEVSGRYVIKVGDIQLEFYIPDEFHAQPDNKKQGASPEVLTTYTPRPYYSSNEFYSALVTPEPRSIHEDGVALCQKCENFYTDLVNSNVAVEEARMFLPQNMMTSYYVTGSLAAFARFYMQRTDSHAQLAIQEHARLVGPQIEALYPYSWKVLTDEAN